MKEDESKPPVNVPRADAPSQNQMRDSANLQYPASEDAEGKKEESRLNSKISNKSGDKTDPLNQTLILDQSRAANIANNLKKSSRRDVYNMNKNEPAKGKETQQSKVDAFWPNLEPSQSNTVNQRDTSIFNIQTSVIGMSKHRERGSDLAGEIPGEIPTGDPSLNELVKASKLAVSQQRKQTIIEQLHSNNIQITNKQQFYNPYHLSSYNRIKTPPGADDGQEVQIQIQNLNDNFGRDGKPRSKARKMENEEPVTLRTSPKRDFIMGIRKQQRKKKEIETNAKKSFNRQQKMANMAKLTRFKAGTEHTSKLGIVQGKSPATILSDPTSPQGTVSHSKKQIYKGRAKGQVPLGVMGQPARMVKTLNYGSLAKEQMTQIEEMQQQIKQNLQLLRQAKNADSFANIANSITAPNPKLYHSQNTIYKMDPAFKEMTEYGQNILNDFAYQQGKKHLSFLYKIQGASHTRQRPVDTLRDSQTSIHQSRLSCQKRRFEALKALETYVMNEELQKNQISGINISKSPHGASKGKDESGKLQHKPTHNRSQEPDNDYGLPDHTKNINIDSTNVDRVAPVDPPGPSIGGGLTDPNNQTITNDPMELTSNPQLQKKIPTFPDDDKSPKHMKERSIDMIMRGNSPMILRNTKDQYTIHRQYSGINNPPQSTLKKKNSANQILSESGKPIGPLSQDGMKNERTPVQMPAGQNQDVQITQIKIQNQIPNFQEFLSNNQGYQNSSNYTQERSQDPYGRGEVTLKERKFISREQTAPVTSNKRRPRAYLGRDPMKNRQKSCGGYQLKKVHQQHIKSPGRLASTRPGGEQIGDIGIMQGVKLGSKQLIDQNQLFLQQLMSEGVFYTTNQEGELIKHTKADVVIDYTSKPDLQKKTTKEDEAFTKSSDLASAIHVPQASLQHKMKNQDLFSPKEKQELNNTKEGLHETDFGLKEEKMDIQHTASSGETKRDPNRTVEGGVFSTEEMAIKTNQTPPLNQEQIKTISNQNSSINHHLKAQLYSESFMKANKSLSINETSIPQNESEIVNQSIDQANLIDGFKGILPQQALDKVNLLCKKTSQPKNKIIELLLKNQQYLFHQAEALGDSLFWPQQVKLVPGGNPDLMVTGSGLKAIQNQRYSLEDSETSQMLQAAAIKNRNSLNHHAVLSSDQYNLKERTNKDIQLSLDQNIPVYSNIYAQDQAGSNQPRRKTAPGWAGNRGRRMQIDKKNTSEGIRSQLKNHQGSFDIKDSIEKQGGSDGFNSDFFQGDAPSNIAMAVLSEVDNAQRRRKELRNLLTLKDRKKFNFIPRPPLKFLQFSNKSEEKRFGQLAVKILQMDYMNENQISQLYSQIKRFLYEYQNLIRFGSPRAAGRNLTGSPLGRISPSRAIDLVEDQYVIKMIEAVRRLHEKEEDCHHSAKKVKVGTVSSQQPNYELYLDSHGKLMYQDNFNNTGGATSEQLTFSQAQLETKSNKNHEEQATGELPSGVENQSINSQVIESRNLTYRKESISVERTGGDLEESAPQPFINFIRQVYGLNEIQIPFISAGPSRLEGQPTEPQIIESNSQSYIMQQQKQMAILAAKEKEKEDQQALQEKILGHHQQKELPGIALEDPNIRWVGGLIEEEVNSDPAIHWARDYLKKLKFDKYKVFPQDIKEWKEEIRYQLNQSAISRHFSDQEGERGDSKMEADSAKDFDPTKHASSDPNDAVNSNYPYSSGAWQPDSRLDGSIKNNQMETYGAMSSTLSRTQQVYSQQQERRVNLGRHATNIDKYEQTPGVLQHPKTRYAIKSSQGLKPMTHHGGRPVHLAKNYLANSMSNDVVSSAGNPVASYNGTATTGGVGGGLLPQKIGGGVAGTEKRRQKLTLEHIMHQRVREKEEDEVCAELHRELRNLEKKQEKKQIKIQWKGLPSTR